MRTVTWIKTKPVENKSLVLSLRQELDAGEAEAIALALELDAGLLIMDERLGRETARHLGVHYTGLIGVLIEAKHRRSIAEIKPLLDRLRDTAGFRINQSLYEQVLEDAGELHRK